MERRKIGVIIAQAEENSQSLFMKGLMEEAYVYGYDICVFSMYLRFQDTLYRQIGDSNIYNLIQWDAFDAIIVLPDTIQATDIATRLEDKIHEVFSGVVLFVDKDSRYFPIDRSFDRGSSLFRYYVFRRVEESCSFHTERTGI